MIMLAKVQMSTHQQEELDVVEGSVCNYFHLTLKLSSHTWQKGVVNYIMGSHVFVVMNTT